jgi:hypothetical protein
MVKLYLQIIHRRGPCNRFFQYRERTCRNWNHPDQQGKRRVHNEGLLNFDTFYPSWMRYPFRKTHLFKNVFSVLYVYWFIWSPYNFLSGFCKSAYRRGNIWNSSDNTVLQSLWKLNGNRRLYFIWNTFIFIQTLTACSHGPLGESVAELAWDTRWNEDLGVSQRQHHLFKNSLNSEIVRRCRGVTKAELIVELRNR